MFDVVLVYQYIYYLKCRTTLTPLDKKVRPMEIAFYVFACILAILNVIWIGEYNSMRLVTDTANIDDCPVAPILPEGLVLSGDIMAYLSIPMFLASRPGQISKLIRKKTSEGLSLGMFSLTVFANLT